MDVVEDIYWDFQEVVFFYSIYILQQFQILTHSWYEGFVLLAYFAGVIFMLRKFHKKWSFTTLSFSKLLIIALLYSITIGPGVFGLGGVSTAPFPWMFGYSLFMFDVPNIIMNLKLLCFNVVGFTVIFIILRLSINVYSRKYQNKS